MSLHAPRRFLASLIGLALILGLGLSLQTSAADGPWVVFEGKQGAGVGKKLVFIAADDEYQSAVGMPYLARILAEHHGFTCTVLFAINPGTGAIDSGTQDNIPGLEALDQADGMVIFTRFRALPDEQMKHIIDFTNAGKGIIGLRTATHAFNFDSRSTSAYKQYSFNSTVPGFEGGFGRVVLGETWINHWGGHGSQSTRGLLAPGITGNPIVNGIKDGDIWGLTDVYEVRLPMLPGITPVIMGQVLTGNHPNDAALPGKKNDPMMPVAWTRTYTGPSGKIARVFATTMGGRMGDHPDWESEGFRRLIVNAAYWITGMEDRIPAKAEVAALPDMPFANGYKPQDFKP